MFIDNIGSFSAPVLIFLVLLFAIKRKINIFSSFLEGATEGINCIFSILPSVVAMITAVTIFNSSGSMDLLKSLLATLFKYINIPDECLSLIIMKPISGSGSNAILVSIFNSSGPDSYAGNLSSVISGSSEAIFYIVSTYCGSLNTKCSNRLILLSLAAFVGSLLCSVIIS